jgi:hypothetical protein
VKFATRENLCFSFSESQNQIASVVPSATEYFRAQEDKKKEEDSHSSFIESAFLHSAANGIEKNTRKYLQKQ